MAETEETSRTAPEEMDYRAAIHKAAERLFYMFLSPTGRRPEIVVHLQGAGAWAELYGSDPHGSVALPRVQLVSFRGAVAPHSLGALARLAVDMRKDISDPAPCPELDAVLARRDAWMARCSS